MSLAPLELVAAGSWRWATFTTYALSLSFFEAVVLDALARAGGAETTILADVEGVRASLGELGATRVGTDYVLEPVAVSGGVFHPKVSVLAGNDDAHLLVGSGNLTFSGWGGNLEVLEHLHPSFAAAAFADAAEFFELLAIAEPQVRHEAARACDGTADRLRRAARGGGGDGSIRFLHGLLEPLTDQIAALAADLGGAERLLAAAPFWDDGSGVERLRVRLGLDSVFAHSHDGPIVQGHGGRNWPTAGRVHGLSAVSAAPLAKVDDGRALHAKMFEVVCRRGRLVISGSANASGAALESQNVEACIVRLDRSPSSGWALTPAGPPAPGLMTEEERSEQDRHIGVLRAELDCGRVTGRVLQPRLTGRAALFESNAAERRYLGEIEVNSIGKFSLNAPDLELRALTSSRMVLRLEAGAVVAEGFLWNRAVSDLKARAGWAAPRLLALLAGTETPADVAAIVAWFQENPERLRTDLAAKSSGQRSPDQKSGQVLVSELLGTGASPDLSHSGIGGHKGAQAWVRMMEHILAALRQPRARFLAADEDAVGSSSTAEEIAEPDSPTAADLARAGDQAFSNLDRLLDQLLAPGAGAASAMLALDVSQFVCRLGPTSQQAQDWLERALATITAVGAPAERIHDVAAATLVLHGVAEGHPVRARKQLLRLGWALEGPCPDPARARGFQDAIQPTIAAETLWARLQAVRTPGEQVRSFRGSVETGEPPGFLPDLVRAKEAWDEIKGAHNSDRARRRLLFTPELTGTCPKCSVSLPATEFHELRAFGIARARNCCDRVILCEAL